MEYFQKAADKGSPEAHLYIGLGHLCKYYTCCNIVHNIVVEFLLMVLYNLYTVYPETFALLNFCEFHEFNSIVKIYLVNFTIMGVANGYAENSQNLYSQKNTISSIRENIPT